MMIHKSIQIIPKDKKLDIFVLEIYPTKDIFRRKPDKVFSGYQSLIGNKNLFQIRLLTPQRAKATQRPNGAQNEVHPFFFLNKQIN